MGRTSKAILIALLFWLTGHATNGLTQERVADSIGLELTRDSRAVAEQSAHPGFDLVLLLEEMSQEELEAMTGKGLGGPMHPCRSARIILGDEVDVEQVSGTAFHNHGGSTLNVQMNAVVIGTN